MLVRERKLKKGTVNLRTKYTERNVGNIKYGEKIKKNKREKGYELSETRQKGREGRRGTVPPTEGTENSAVTLTLSEREREK